MSRRRPSADGRFRCKLHREGFSAQLSEAKRRKPVRKVNLTCITCRQLFVATLPLKKRDPDGKWRCSPCSNKQKLAKGRAEEKAIKEAELAAEREAAYEALNAPAPFGRCTVCLQDDFLGGGMMCGDCIAEQDIEADRQRERKRWEEYTS
jgi:hypothetical protein